MKIKTRKTNIWNIKILLIGTLLAVVGIAGCQTDGAIDQTKVGLGLDGVFNDPPPSVFEFTTLEPGENYLIPTSFSTAPPMVPHTVAEFLPITLETNECMECHDKPKLVGREFVKGKKIGMPRSHYGGFGGTGDEDEVSGSRFMCSQCHVPLSDAEPLIGNLF